MAGVVPTQREQVREFGRAAGQCLVDLGDLDLRPEFVQQPSARRIRLVVEASRAMRLHKAAAVPT
ncbi:hypothetical protein [Kribbella sp. NPDC004536]|uniref:hypothetical protein n=1 Tax=Kribbella sp. NPDC004536 TaxID=3364106 RepID=UPI00369ACF62